MNPAHTIKKNLANLLTRFPVIGKRFSLYRAYQSIPHPPGHYYSLIPDLVEVERHAQKIFDNDCIKGIDLRLNQQMELVQQLQHYFDSLPYHFDNPALDADAPYRYKADSQYYRYSDAIFLFCMLRHFKPSRIIEIGSGHSSALMLDTNEHFFGNGIRMDFVEPYPEERLYHVLRKGDEKHARVIKSLVQEVPTDVFTGLKANDILFVDSSHVSKPGSDVNYIFFEVLPVLQPGVLIHFHDIFYPFELPKQWVLERKWFWNENYLLRAFLMNNPDYEIVLFNNLLHKKFGSWFEKEMPECLIEQEYTGSIWLRKIR